MDKMIELNSKRISEASHSEMRRGFDDVAESI